MTGMVRSGVGVELILLCRRYWGMVKRRESQGRRTMRWRFIEVIPSFNRKCTVQRISNNKQAIETIRLVRERCVQTTNPGPGNNNGSTITNRKYLSRVGMCPLGSGRKEFVNRRYYPYRSTCWPLVISAYPLFYHLVLSGVQT